MSEISLGGFTQQNGRTTAGGFASGLDSTTIITNILAARQASIDAKTAAIKTNNDKVTAIGQLRTLLERFRTSVDFLRNSPGVGQENNNFFKHTSTTSLSNTDVSASTYIDVQSTAGAVLNSYTIDNISLAREHILRKDGFTSDSTSVVGNASTTDNYSATWSGSLAGTALNTTTPILFANDVNTDGVATKAHLDVLFGDQNEFDATDTLTIGATVLTFGGTGGADLDLSSATDLEDKIDAIVTYMNTVNTGTESNANYTYSQPTPGILRIERDTAGSINTVGQDLSVSADFSNGSDTTQTVGFGKLYTNNGSAEGSVALSNGVVSGSVADNGVDGIDASTKASINVVFGVQNDFQDGHTLSFGATTLTFATSGGDSGDTLDISGDIMLADKLTHIVNHMNAKVTGAVSGYSFTTNGTNTIIVTRDVYGSNSTASTHLSLDADFSGTGGTQTINFGSQGASTNPTLTHLDTSGTDGVDSTSISTAKTTAISTLSGAINLTANAPEFYDGTDSATSFTPNYVIFKATVGGATYSSQPVYLDGGSLTGGGGTGLNGRGNRIPAGTTITFVKDTQTDTTEGTRNVTFQLVTGAEATIANQAGATAYQQTTLNNFLNVDNTVTISQTTPTFRAGTFTLGGQNIELTAGDNLRVIKSKINSLTSLSGVIADVIQVSSSSYSLVLKSSETGVENRILEYADGGGDADPGDPPDGKLQFGLDNVAFSLIQAYADASMDIDGLTITRATNTIDDAIEKLTFNLKTDTPVATTITTSIDPDTATIKSGITDFLNSYNDLKIFIAKQGQRNADGTLAEGSVLGDDNLMSDLLRSVNEELNRTISGLSSGALNTLFAAGIDFQDYPGDDSTPAVKDIFVLDESKFDSVIASSFDEVRRVFTFDFVANSSEIGVFSRNNKATLTDFTLDIDETRTGNEVRVLDSDGNYLFNATYTPVTDKFGTPLLGRGGTITGVAGTSLDGLVLVYSGDGSDSIDVNMTQGIADRIFNLLDNALADGNVVDTAVTGLQDENTRTQDDIDTETIRMNAERELLISKFTQLEAFISEVNNTLRFFDAQRAQTLGSSGG